MTSQQTKRTGEQCVSVSLSELLLLSKGARELSLSAARVRSSQAGQHLSRLYGRGMEFAESRRYQEGDDIRSIDWRVTARTGKVHSKLFAAEKERQVLFCIDMRSPMFFATKGMFKSVQASLIGGNIAWSAVLNGNRLGGLIFDDARQEEFRPAPGKRGVLPLLQRLAEQTAVNSKRGAEVATVSMDGAIQSLKRVASPGSMVFVISDFRKFSSSARDLLIHISTHCDLCLCFLFDPLEAALPKNGYYPVCDGRGELQLDTFNKRSLERYRLSFIERRHQVASLGQLRHIQFLECSTEEDCFGVLKEHFR